MAILMLCDTPVYNIASDTVLNEVFCPFKATGATKKSYERWRSNRVYLKTNRIAERVVQQAGGFGTHEAKRRLSLSDGYWVRYSYDKDTWFHSVTPYKNRFSEANIVRGGVRSSSVPELVIGGSQPKQWARSSDGVTYLRKAELPEQVNAEMAAVKIIRKCGAKVMNAFIQTDKGRIYADNYDVSKRYANIGIINLVNMTNVKRSMLQFDQLGVFVDGYNPISVAEGFKSAGVKDKTVEIAILHVIIDAIVGNTDRRNNASNWAIFMDNETGHRKPSWLYDFNWASFDFESIEQIEIVANNIIKAGVAVRNIALGQVRHIYGVLCTEQYEFKSWRKNARRLLEKLS